MANEYLKRTPTSIGNRKKWTWAGWVKINKDFGSSDYNTVWSVAAGTSGDNSDRFHLYHYSDGRWVTTGTSSFSQIFTGPGGSAAHSRDPGTWMHICLSVDTTGPTLDKDKYQRFWVNGIEYNYDDAGNIGDNTDLAINGLYEHYIGTRNSSAQRSYDGQMFDLYLVDGQALTPDVFGYYKDGAGYISVGSTLSTSFKRGQWVPKKPSAIKAAINAEGGFGVNGYYLPINDGSNMGADFHCEPNSIITLKGENNPQPRNGAPTTTDAYVSQLREDPYAANLVLAVPGISTSTSANLVTNGTFDTNTTGWTAGNSGTLSVDAGRLKVTNGTSSAGYAYQEITVEVGKRYTVNLEGITGTSASNTRIGTVVNAADYGNKIGSGLVNISFTATSTSLYVTLKPNSNTNGNNALFDNVVVKQEDAPRDYSADIKGSGIGKTVTANGQASVGYEIPSYYGSALSFDGTGDYFSVPNTSDFRFTSEDFTIEAWIKTNDVTDDQFIFGNWNATDDRRAYLLWIEQGTPRYNAGTDGTNSDNGNIDPGNAVVVYNDEWAHVAVSKEGSTNRVFLNGVCVGINTTGTDIYDNTTDTPLIGGEGGTGTREFNGYIQDLRVYKGVAKYKSGFDVPKPYTPVGIETWRAVPDTTANNFTTMNPLIEARPSSGSNTDHASSIITFADGNLSLTNASSSGNSQKMIAFSSVGFSTGKWYYEEITGSNGRLCLSKGVQQLIYSSGIAGAGTGIEALVRINASDGIISIANTAYYSTATPANLTAESFDTTNVMGVTIDASLGKNNLTVQFYKDGVGIATLTGIGATSPVEEWFPTKLPRSSGSADEAYFNFGQNPTFSGRVTAGTYTDDNGKGLFKYQPPSGFLALCEDNLPTPAIADPGEHFKCVLYRGDGNTGHSITGVGFQPDLVWIKERTSTSSHQLHDSVRGAGNLLISNVTNAESYSATYLYSLDSDGFTLGSSGGVNASTDDYVAWCWKAGVGTTSTNTDGAVNSVVSVNQTAGFSIIKVDGLPASTTSTFGHGLNKKPDFIIFKSRNNATNWDVYHSSLTPDGERKLYLNGTNAEIDSGFMGDTPPTSSVISFNPGSSNSNHIVYCWTEIEGFSKFGSYVGNGDADGPFVYCGFKPAVVIQKIVTDTNNWIINDSSINSTNPSTVGLRLNTNGQEIDSASNILDFCSNGFKIRGAGSVMNTANETYIFAAFAESPFTTANAK